MVIILEYGAPGSFATRKKMGDNVEGPEPRSLMSPVIIPGHSDESTTSIEIHEQGGETCHMSHTRPLAPIPERFRDILRGGENDATDSEPRASIDDRPGDPGRRPGGRQDRGGVLLLPALLPAELALASQGLE
jgi:hypothetical protein